MKNNEWTISDRDSDMHQLDWAKKNPEKFKKEIVKFYEETGENIDLKKEYPILFND
jgi:hypothetical protein